MFSVVCHSRLTRHVDADQSANPVDGLIDFTGGLNAGVQSVSFRI